jgi:curli biogenesis system outer membrane secretion channel CsgG
MKKGYLVVERSRVDQVLKEQSLGLTGAIDESTAGKIGKILGVQALIIGTVGNYKATTRTKITPTKHGPKGGMEFESTASITIKMVDVVDSGIVWAGEGNCIASGSNPAVPLEATIKALIKKFPRR